MTKSRNKKKPRGAPRAERGPKAKPAREVPVTSKIPPPAAAPPEREAPHRSEARPDPRPSSTLRPGTLYLVSTPIGNLGDMTLRGIETLRAADAILAEDTRHTRRLLAHFGIQNAAVAYHDHNKERVTPALVARLEAGETLALVSDAGTPGISDPGFYLVRAVLAASLSVIAVPGANAILPALLVSGFPTDAFVFEGFLPRKPGELRRRMAALVDETRTVVWFVSPHRLRKVLAAAAEVIPQRTLAVVRELTKIHEEVRRGTAAELLAHYDETGVRGEIVVLVKGKGK